MYDWKKYFHKHLNRKPKVQLIRALNFCVNKDDALDLGAGTLIESRAILDSGFKKVIAIDNAPDTVIFAKNFNNSRLYFKNISFKEYHFQKDTLDLVNAEFSLPFYGKDNFKDFFNEIIGSLKTQGIFSGQLFGIKDSWNTLNSKIIFHTEEQVLKLLSPLEILEFTEEEKDEKTASSDELKHWHIFRFIVRKI